MNRDNIQVKKTGEDDYAIEVNVHNKNKVAQEFTLISLPGQYHEHRSLKDYRGRFITNKAFTNTVKAAAILHNDDKTEATLKKTLTKANKERMSLHD